MSQGAELFVHDGEHIHPFRPTVSDGSRADVPPALEWATEYIAKGLSLPVAVALFRTLPRHGNWSYKRMERVIAEIDSALMLPRPYRNRHASADVQDALAFVLHPSRLVKQIETFMREWRTVRRSKPDTILADPEDAPFVRSIYVAFLLTP